MLCFKSVEISHSLEEYMSQPFSSMGPQLCVQVLRYFGHSNPCLLSIDKRQSCPTAPPTVSRWALGSVSMLVLSQWPRSDVVNSSSLLTSRIHYTLRGASQPSGMSAFLGMLGRRDRLPLLLSNHFVTDPKHANAVWLSGPARLVRHASGLAPVCAEISQPTGISRLAFP